MATGGVSGLPWTRKVMPPPSVPGSATVNSLLESALKASGPKYISASSSRPYSKSRSGVELSAGKTTTSGPLPVSTAPATYEPSEVTATPTGYAPVGYEPDVARSETWSLCTWYGAPAAPRRLAPSGVKIRSSKSPEPLIRFQKVTVGTAVEASYTKMFGGLDPIPVATRTSSSTGLVTRIGHVDG